MEDLKFITIPQGINVNPIIDSTVSIPQFQLADTPVTRLLFWEVCKMPKVNRDILLYETLQIDSLYETPDNLDFPASSMTEAEVMEFCTRLSLETGLYITLPTCDQWEWACNQGELTDFWFGDEFDHAYANVFRSGLSAAPPTHTPVKSYPPNKLGLYDMHGNVWEIAKHADVPSYWVQKKGGSLYSPPRRSRTYNRGQCYSDERVMSTGFRVCINQTEPATLNRQSVLDWLVS
jgi:formylglycine-generating enzyme required for sulfatase activity